MLYASSQPKIGAHIMTGKMSFAGKVRVRATDKLHHAHQAPERCRWIYVVKHLWPTLSESV
jgi:hypothetical protein